MSSTSTNALNDVLFLARAALTSTEGEIYQDKHERMVRGLAHVLASMDIDPAGTGESPKPLLSLLVNILQHDTPDDALFEPLLARFGPRLFESPPGGPSTTRVALDTCFQAKAKSSSWGANDKVGRPKCAAWLIRHAPQDALTAWDRHGDTPGAGLVARLLDVPWGWQALGAVKERGTDWTLAMRDGQPLVRNMRRVGQWKAFLQQGGDAEMKVMEPITKQSQPLWQHLLGAKALNDKMAEVLKNWLAQQHEPSQTVQDALKDFSYWTGFASAPANREGMLGYLMSMPGWENKQDSQGVPAWAHAVSMVPSTLTSLVRDPSRRQAVAQRDGMGRSPWFYLLPLMGDRHLPGFNDIKAGLAALEKPTLDNQGRGLLFSVAEAELEPRRFRPELVSLFGRRERPANIVSYFPDDQDNTYLGRMTAEDWTTGTAEQHDALAEKILATSHSDKLERLVRFVLHLPPSAHDTLSPRLKGALVLTALRSDPFRGLAAELQRASVHEAQRIGPAKQFKPLSWLYQGEAVFPEDGVVRLKTAMKEGAATIRTGTAMHPELSSLMDEHATVMERVILGQSLDATMAAGSAASRRARI